jgi:RHH-type proline utilization regulon transcriptional repressor/proline dehydrogenase/delta 1-pyrroline-5-carboxylate dehydrogenase
MSTSPRRWLSATEDGRLPGIGGDIGAHYLADETGTVRVLAEQAASSPADTDSVLRRARELVAAMRRNRKRLGGIDAFMSEYDLSSQEGIVLMCLAEALLRIPDDETIDRLIADKLGAADFHEHLGDSESLFVNATTWALMLTGRIVHAERLKGEGLGRVFELMLGRLGEPVIRAAMRRAMSILARQFVMGRTIDEALERAAEPSQRRYRYSFDMLGEAALTATAASRYFDAYAGAIDAIGAAGAGADDPAGAPALSVKLSALTPRFEYAQWRRALRELSDRLGQLAKLARDAGIALTVDAEEADRLELTLAVFETVFRSPQSKDWPGLGIAVQAYQKRALPVVGWLEALAASERRTMPVRLVKGAYWDTEIKRAQEQGLAGYPVFTRKMSTDVSYLACARRLLNSSPHLYPQFATHNGHTVAWLLHAGADRPFEFQRLHGMGEDLYSEIVTADAPIRPCRVYAPVGSHEDLLPYLVRRLLENGANTSFVNRVVHDETSIDELVRDPLAEIDALGDAIPNPRIPLPRDLFGDARRNSAGINLADPGELEPLAAAMRAAAAACHDAVPLVDGRAAPGDAAESHDPADRARRVGSVRLATPETARAALDAAARSHAQWNAWPAAERAAVLRAAADELQTRRAELAALCVAEGGRCARDGLSEVREATDFLRYYAYECERLFAAPLPLPGPTGERNSLRLTGRGVFLCISPWNFPVAIFAGQVAAALAAGNAVLAKPAEQTSVTAARVVELLLEAGVPEGALQFLPGPGAEIAGALLPDARLAGVAFTGSLATAKQIERRLAARDGPIAALIAETGGVNAMIVDSSALPEQVVKDVITSAFNSAGQRCSALRLLCLQRDTADAVLDMLIGAMAQLTIGSPSLLETDVGPVIDAEALAGLRDYVGGRASQVLHRCALNDTHERGTFFPPTLIELDRASDLTEEVFGPVLHVVRYASEDVDALIDELNGVGFGLTLGVHSRIDSFAAHVTARARVGNVYVNRNMIGAVVGVQPFGGMGLSGTGPKVGGPHYLPRFAVEQAVAVNTAAVGGNATLLSQRD